VQAARDLFECAKTFRLGDQSPNAVDERRAVLQIEQRALALLPGQPQRSTVGR
jgi:hypothetical protein